MTPTTIGTLRQSWMRIFGLMGDTIRGFTPEAWAKGFTWFQMPAKVAYHTIECIDFYFKPKGETFAWGSRLGKPYWQMSEEELPTQEDLLTWLGELETRVMGHLGAVSDDELCENYDPTLPDPATAVEWYVYALSHTLHHHGSLVALADILGTPSGDWDKWGEKKLPE